MTLRDRVLLGKSRNDFGAGDDDRIVLNDKAIDTCLGHRRKTAIGFTNTRRYYSALIPASLTILA